MKKRGRSGFTLLEIIVSLVLVSILASLAVSFFGAGVKRTDVPMTQLQTDSVLQATMENIIQDYKNKFTKDLPSLTNKIQSAGTTSSVYAPSGASYYVSENTYVSLSGNAFTSSGTETNYLLVTIKPSSASGVSLTYLFTKQ